MSQLARVGEDGLSWVRNKKQHSDIWTPRFGFDLRSSGLDEDVFDPDLDFVLNFAARHSLISERSVVLLLFTFGFEFDISQQETSAGV